MNRNLVLKKSSVAVVIKNRVLRLAVCALLSLVLILGLIPMPFGGGNGVGGALVAHAADVDLGLSVEIHDFSLEGTVGVPLDNHYRNRNPVQGLQIELNLDHYGFNTGGITQPNDWVKNLPEGIHAEAVIDEANGAYIYFYGTPQEASTENIQIVIPGANIYVFGGSTGDNYKVGLNDAMKFNIKAPVKGNTILFGTYPQTRSVVAPQNAPNSPTNGLFHEYGGIKYEYVDSSDDQYDGWYRYDPIEWRVASKSSDKLFLIAEKAIDGKPVLQNSPANYQYKVWQQSTIRSWLNGYGESENVNNINYSASGMNFITKSFSAAQAGAITSTALTASSTRNEDYNPQNHPNALVDTTDKIFLLSIKDAKNTAYNFSTDSMENDPLRQAVPTDYAKAVGTSYSSEINTASWWLRSDGENFYTHGAYVFPPGRVLSGGTTMSSKNGVRPVLNLDLSKVIFTVESDDESGVVFNAIPDSDYVIIDFDDERTDGANFVHQIIREKNTPVGILPDGILRTGYSFTGWRITSSEGIEVTGSNSFATDTTLYAHWEARDNTITWNPTGGTPTPDATVIASGVTLGTLFPNGLPVPELTGYSLAGWRRSNGGNIGLSSYVVRDTALYAYWTANLYAVTFDANGGAIGSDVQLTTNQKYNAKYVLPANPTRTGYTFDGWYTSDSGGTQVTDQTIVNITSAQQLYAHWNINSYTATFNANGGSVSPASSTLNYGSPIGTLSTPARTGYTFDGWYTEASGGTQITDATLVTADVTYYAHWTLEQSGNNENDKDNGNTVQGDGNGYENNVKTDDEDSSQQTDGLIDLATFSTDAKASASNRIAVADKVWTGKALKSGFAITAGGKKLKTGTDYTITANGTNKDIGKGSVTINGAGLYKGTKVLSFKITPKKGAIKKVTVGKKSITVKWSKLSASQKITGYKVEYKLKGATKWKVQTVSAKNTSLVIKGLKKDKKYQVRIYAYKTIKSGASKETYNAPYSATKTSTKVK